MSNVNTHDLEALKAFGHRAEEFEKIKSGFVYEAEIKVASENGYVLGVLVWSSDSDSWQWDLSNYGQDV